MTMMLLFAMAAWVGAAFPRRMTIVIPPLVGGIVLAGLALTGHDISDTPIPFVAITATGAVALGAFLRTDRPPKSA